MPKNLTSAVCYYRVSTQSQVDEYSSMSAYRQRFIDFGFTDLSKHYYDVASGGSKDREGYQAVLNLVRQGLIDTVYIPEISRLSRDIGHFQEVLELFQQNNVKLITLDGHHFDFLTPTGSLNVNLQVLFAENTRRTNQYRALKGHEYLRSQGKATKAVFPYLKINAKLEPNHNQYKQTNFTVWQIGQEIVALFLETGVLSETIEKMVLKYGDRSGKLWEDFPRNHSSFRDWLKSQAIRGNLEYFGGRRYKYKPNAPKPIVLYQTHEPLISPSQSRRILQLLAIAGKTKTNFGKIKNLWVGILKCECGAPMKAALSVSSTGNVFNYLVCKSAYPNSSDTRARQSLGLVEKCDRRSSYGLTVEKLDEIVISELTKKSREIAETFMIGDRNEEVLSPELIEINKQITTYEILAQSDDDMIPLLNKKIKQRNYLLSLQAGDRDAYINELKSKLITYGRDTEFWMSATPLEKKALYADFISEIVCSFGEVAIQFKF